VSFPFYSFKRWVPPPPNLSLMTDVEKDEASAHRVCNPPACKCSYRAELVNPSIGLDYTSFFRCPVSLTVILAKRLYIFYD
jgi:hypothetical protein